MKGSASRPRPDYRSLWQRYSSWQKEDEQWYTRAKAAERARMGAAGIQKGSAAWDRRMQNIDKQYSEKQEELHQGATYRALERNWRADQTQRVSAIRKTFAPQASSADPGQMGRAIGDPGSIKATRQILEETVNPPRRDMYSSPGEREGMGLPRRRRTPGQIEETTRRSAMFAPESARAGGFGTTPSGALVRKFGKTSRPAAAQEALKELDAIEEETLDTYYRTRFGEAGAGNRTNQQKSALSKKQLASVSGIKPNIWMNERML